MPYRRCGASGLLLPPISLGLWHNFGDFSSIDDARGIVRRAFDLGISHFDLANNYGPPYGAAEATFGRIMRADLTSHRDELIISTKAGYDMWAGPYGDGGSRKYLLASLDQSLERLGIDYVDIFYSHRFDPLTPLEETMGAIDSAVRRGKVLYAGISSYPPEATRQAAEILTEMGTPLLIHQPSYSLFDRWIEAGLLEVLEEKGVGCIAFSPLAEGLLSAKYLDGVPAQSERARTASCVGTRSPMRSWRRCGPWTPSLLGAGIPCSDGPRLGAARPTYNLRPRRCPKHRAAGGESRGLEVPRVQRGGARRDRQPYPGGLAAGGSVDGRRQQVQYQPFPVEYSAPTYRRLR